MFIQYILYACVKYEKYFIFNNMEPNDMSHEMVRNYHRLKEILTECRKKDISDEEANKLFGVAVEKIYHAIQCQEFVCKVSKVAYLGDMKILAQFWGDYYAELDFDKVLQLPEVQERHPEYEKLREPEVFHQIYPAEYHVFFGMRPERIDVTSGFIWHFGKQIKHQINESDYEWIKGV